MAPDGTSDEVSPVQELALTSLLEGCGPSDVCAELSIGRSTLWRWRNQPGVFRDEYQRRRAELTAANRQSVSALIPRAISAVSAALNEGDAAIGVQVLRGLNWCQPDGEVEEDDAAASVDLDISIDGLIREIEENARAAATCATCGEKATAQGGAVSE